jgi:V8-like Glu-specific endopeptidase
MFAPLKISALALASVAAPFAAFAQSGAVAVTSAPGAAPSRAVPDYANSIPKPLPVYKGYSRAKRIADITKAANLRPKGTEDFSGNRRPNPGDGTLAVVALPKRAATVSSSSAESFGSAGLPYTTARADLEPTPTNRSWPYRAAGKLFFLDGGTTYNCSGSMIDRGLVVTAAHCVASNGKHTLYTGFRFIPGYRETEAPFGEWEVAKVYVLPSYVAGKDCISGTVCKDDVAVLALVPQKIGGKDRYAGDSTGWFGYAAGTDPYTSVGLTQITQLGYPLCLNDGEFMQRNDAQGAISKESKDNTIYGSLMCGGSSGGPVIANFGVRSDTTGTVDGKFAQPNVVIGVTSWGYTDNEIKQQGASPFLASNITILVKAACKENPSACKP